MNIHSSSETPTPDTMQAAVLHATTSIKLSADGDSFAQLFGLHSAHGDEYEQRAYVTLTIYQQDQTEVPGIKWPVVLTPTGEGSYATLLAMQQHIDTDQLYTAVFHAVTRSGDEGHWEIDARAFTNGYWQAIH